jgi:hypothetical protein
MYTVPRFDDRDSGPGVERRNFFENSRGRQAIQWTLCTYEALAFEPNSRSVTQRSSMISNSPSDCRRKQEEQYTEVAMDWHGLTRSWYRRNTYQRTWICIAYIKKKETSFKYTSSLRQLLD